MPNLAKEIGGARRNRTAEYRFCRPMPSHLATAPQIKTNEHRTRTRIKRKTHLPRQHLAVGAGNAEANGLLLDGWPLFARRDNGATAVTTTEAGHLLGVRESHLPIRMELL